MSTKKRGKQVQIDVSPEIWKRFESYARHQKRPRGAALSVLLMDLFSGESEGKVHLIDPSFPLFDKEMA